MAAMSDAMAATIAATALVILIEGFGGTEAMMMIATWRVLRHSLQKVGQALQANAAQLRINAVSTWHL